MFNETISKIQKRKARKGFSLVELVVVILIIAILAVAVFAGGSVVIKKSQVSRTTSDLHNFSVAAESLLNENPNVANVSKYADMKAGSDFDILDKLNANLPEDYELKLLGAAETGNITSTKGAPDDADAYFIAKSDKQDAWGNNYYVVFDSTDRNNDGKSDFFIEVISAGPDAKTAVDGKIGGENSAANKNDDIFLLAQYTDGDVAATTYNVAKNDKIGANKLEKGTAEYTGDVAKAPINF